MAAAACGRLPQPDGHYAYVTHILARYQEPTPSSTGMDEHQCLSIIDVVGLRWLNTVLLDDVDCVQPTLGCGLYPGWAPAMRDLCRDS